MKNKKTRKYYIEKAILIHGDKYDYSLVEENINSRSIIDIICPIHDKFSQEVRVHINNKSGCKKCAIKTIKDKLRKSQNHFIKKAKKEHGDKYNYSLVKYIDAKIDVDIICPVHGVFKQTPSNHYKGYGCPKCGELRKNKKLTKTIEQFIYDANIEHGDKYDYSLVKYIDAKTNINIVCPIHGIFKQTPNKHLNGQGCKKCSIDNKRLNITDIILSFKKEHGNKYDYSLVNYINSKEKIEIICHKHGSFFQYIRKHRSGIGCPSCNESKGERTISLYLDKLNILYTREKRFNECKDKKELPFDFYLPEYNICIEYDGIQHFKRNYYWHNDDDFKILQNHDIIKNNFCKINNIELLRISYKEFNDIEKLIYNYIEKIN